MNKEEWKDLTPKEQWDVLVAMRGPDCHNPDVVKWLTVAVLRAAMSQTIRVGGMINNDLKAVVVPSNYNSSGPYLSQYKSGMDGGTGPANLSPQALFYPGHFYQHVMEAASILGIPVILIKKEDWISAMLSSTHNVVGILEKLVESAKGHPHLPILSSHLHYLKTRGGW